MSGVSFRGAGTCYICLFRVVDVVVCMSSVPSLWLLSKFIFTVYVLFVY